MPRPSGTDDQTFLTLVQARDQLRVGATLDPASAPLVAATIDFVLGLRSKTVAKQLRLAARQRRDDCIRQAALQLEERSVRAKGVALLTVARRYRASSWRHHQNQISCPDSIRGTVHEHLWIAFKIYPSFPDGIRQIQAIIRSG
ncbi:hypothetical protein [Geminicoccus roseus]|uniref:hypothetical protein n=1 Tax=Geminicoccus roseus TaxID=404900 RepID=UPI00041515F5|nr:hypothetical protein [Geminicoccus roseus]